MSYAKSATIYDMIYSFKNYAAEADIVRDAIVRHAPNGGTSLLDVACGTGIHAKHLAESFDVTGIDLSPEMIAVANERLPGAQFHIADMRDFDLGKQFDVVTCLFSSIGYVVTVEALHQTIANFARHVKSGGVVLVEPWFPVGRLSDKVVGMTVPEGNSQFRVVRMGYTTIDGNISTLHFHYMVGTLQGVEYFSEEHVLTCFTEDEYTEAFKAAGLRVTFEMPGLEGRGLYIGVKPA